MTRKKLATLNKVHCVLASNIERKPFIVILFKINSLRLFLGFLESAPRNFCGTLDFQKRTNGALVHRMVIEQLHYFYLYIGFSATRIIFLTIIIDILYKISVRLCAFNWKTKSAPAPNKKQKVNWRFNSLSIAKTLPVHQLSTDNADDLDLIEFKLVWS